MLIKEYRIPLPLTVEEYKIAQLFMIAKKSQLEANDIESGIEILKNEPYSNSPEDSGQYTEKLYYIGSHLPVWIKALLPKNALTVHEKAWNSYPYTKSICTTRYIDKFSIEIETKYLEDGGDSENVFNLAEVELKKREIVLIDIVNNKPVDADYLEEEDPLLFSSKLTGRGPLTKDWLQDYKGQCLGKKVPRPGGKALMCAYKLCRVKFHIWALQTRIESFVDEIALRKLLLRAHRQAWAWQDEWVNLTLEEIRKMEEETKKVVNNRLPHDPEENKLDSSNESNDSDLSYHSTRKNTVSENFLNMNLSIHMEEDELSEDEFFDAEDYEQESAPSPSENLTLVLVVHGGSTLDNDNEGIKQADFATFQSALKDLVDNYYRSCLPTQLHLRLVPCPAICSVPYTLLSSLSPVGFQSPMGTGVPIGALPLLAVSSPIYQTCVDKLISTINSEHAKFLKENPNKKIDVIIIADSVGSIVSFDALSRDQSSNVCGKFKLSFKVSHFFMLGSSIGTILAFRQLNSLSASISKPYCDQIYNLFYPADTLSSRIEPLVSPDFKKVSPINIPNFQHYPMGDQTSIMIGEYTINEDETTGAETKWWGSKRIDYTLFCPERILEIPALKLPALFEASFWESKDSAAFIIRQLCHDIKHEEVPAVVREAAPGQWNRRRTAILLRNASPNHKANDVIMRENSEQTISARFTYGILDFISLAGENVEISIKKGGEWTMLGSQVTDKNGRVTYTLTEKQKLSNGIYPTKMVVTGDLSQIVFYVAVLPPLTQCIVFSIDGAFISNLSVSAKDPKVRPGVVDIVRYWQELGYFIFYISGRPSLQQHHIVSWLAKHNFPFGLVFFADGLTKNPLKHKADLLLEMFTTANLHVRAAYGSNKDIWVYETAKILPSCIHVIGSVSKKNSDKVNSLSEGYASHLTDLKVPGLSRTATGNGRMILSQSCVYEQTMNDRTLFGKM